MSKATKSIINKDNGLKTKIELIERTPANVLDKIIDITSSSTEDKRNDEIVINRE